MRLIDADKLNVELSNRLNEAKYQHEGEDYFTGILEAISMLGEVSTVEERKYGHWTRIDYYPVGHDYICSECKQNSAGSFNFCPYCGARMDEVSEDDR